MQSRIPIGKTRIIPVAVVISVVFGALSFYVLKNADAAFAGAGFVLVCGYFANAYVSIERDRVGGVRLSLSHLLEFFLAFALVIWGASITGSLGWVGESFPVAPIFVLFYVLKLLLTFYLTTGHGERNENRTYWVCITYSLLTIATVFALAWPYSQTTFPGFQLLAWLITWFPVPTLTFVLDIRTENRPSVRFAVWRSAVEILFVCPIFCFLAILLMTLLAIVTEQLGRLVTDLQRRPWPK